MYHTPKVRVTFGALVDAIIPYTPRLALMQGDIQAVGGLYAHVDEYLIWSLDRYLFNRPMASPTAELLNIAAGRLIEIGAAEKSYAQVTFPYGSIFAALSQKDRLKTVTLLEQLQIDLRILPFPFRNNPISVQNIADTLNSLTAFGYFSEWSGYGAKRFTQLANHKLEGIPISWKQVGYPGRARKYPDLRGYLVYKFTE